jgi:hypothetical protein
MTDIDICYPCCILICGCDSVIQRVDVPPPEIQGVLEQTPIFNCIHCRQMRQPMCFRKVTWFSCCFLPIFPFSYDQPFIGCPLCQLPMQRGTEANQCSVCSGWVEQSHRFCPDCGADHTTPVGYAKRVKFKTPEEEKDAK